MTASWECLSNSLLDLIVADNGKVSCLIDGTSDNKKNTSVNAKIVWDLNLLTEYKQTSFWANKDKAFAWFKSIKLNIPRYHSWPLAVWLSIVNNI